MTTQGQSSTQSDSEVARRKTAVVSVVRRLVEDAQDLSSKLQDPRSPTPAPDQPAVWHLVELLGELPFLVHHRLYFSPTLQYFYASQLARRKATTTRSGESVEVVEGRLTVAQRDREAELSTREHLVASLTFHLTHLDTSGAQVVQACRQEARLELDEAKSQSEGSLEQLQHSLEESLGARRSQEARHELAELELRGRRQELETQIQDVIRRYDATMSRLQTRLDDLRTDYASLVDHLRHKKAWLKEVEQQYRTIQEEKQRKEEEKLAALQAEFRREYAARTIQRAWQHYKMRKMLKKAQRKRKKKPKDVKEGKK